MFVAKDFRKFARESLNGKWGMAVLAGFVASLLGGVASTAVDFNLNFYVEEESGSVNELVVSLKQLIQESGIGEELITGILIGAGIGLIIGLAMAAVFVVLGSVVSVGYAKFNLDLVDHQPEADVGTLFGYFKHWKTATVASLLQGLYVFLWSLLLFFPGIYAAYGYAMTPYILAENPELTASEALARSKEMMEGNRWRLFCLEFSFFGWSILCILTAGIGNLWVTPYMQAASAAFYRDVSGTVPAQVQEPVTPYIEDVL